MTHEASIDNSSNFTIITPAVYCYDKIAHLDVGRLTYSLGGTYKYEIQGSNDGRSWTTLRRFEDNSTISGNYYSHYYYRVCMIYSGPSVPYSSIFMEVNL